jgi:hypothetical protein
MFSKILFSVFVFLTCNFALAQKQASIWYFGVRAGLDFREGNPFALTDGALSTEEGSASICDEDGNLLFYTDGVTVYNRFHQSMQNGRNLWGSYTTTQTLIVPKPGADPIYYIFTASPQFDDVFGPGTDSVGFHYSIVDMRLDMGLGSVTEKNVLLFKNTSEKITAVHHANGNDIWVVAHEWGNNNFRSYLVTEEGINTAPNISSVGEIHDGDGPGRDDINRNTLGHMKLSPDGSKIAVAVLETGVFIYNFDNSSGVISRELAIKRDPADVFYGIEFSPSGKRIYFTDVFLNGCGTEVINSFLYQYDIETRKLAEVGKFVGLLGGLQLAIDGRVYAIKCNDATGESNSVGVINLPNQIGISCNFDENGPDLKTGKGMLGSPNFVQSYFLFPDPIVRMPNVFTPRPGDDYNPVFKPIEIENVLWGNLDIINQWGVKVFETKDIFKGWDGGDSSSGVYYWHLYYEGKNGRKGSLKGGVHLIRSSN